MIKGFGRMRYEPRTALFATLFICTFCNSVSAQSIEETSLRLSLTLSNSSVCQGGATYVIAALPIEDESLTLDDAAVLALNADLLAALRRDLPSCIELIDVAAAYQTLNYIQNIGSWRELGAQQRSAIQAELEGADGILSASTIRVSSDFVGAIELTNLATGASLASLRFDVGERYTSLECGAGAASEARGLSILAADLTERLTPPVTLYLASATYQDTFDPLGYGSYISDQLTAAIQAVGHNDITGENTLVRQVSPTQELDLEDNEYAIMVRYWPCGNGLAARLNVTATSPIGDVVSLSQEVSLQALPAGIAFAPPEISEGETASPEQGLAGRAEVDGVEHQSIDFGFITLEPRLIQAGQTLNVSAEPPANCNPFFFDLAEGGRFTPLPIDFFDATDLGMGIVRYDINDTTRYGIEVQPDDELGIHRLGYICQPSGLSQDGVREVLRQLRRDHAESRQGVIQTEGLNVIFATMTYEILR